MSYFTTHHFSSHWSPQQHLKSEDPPVTAVTAPAPAVAAQTTAPTAVGGTEVHPAHPAHHTGLDVLARLLHSLGSHPEGGIAPSRENGIAHPHFDLVETKDAYVVFGELPGLDSGDVTVEVNDHLSTVIVSGELRRGVPLGTEAKDKPEGSGDVGVLHNEAVTDATSVGAEVKPAADEEQHEGTAAPASGGAKHEEAQTPLAGLYWHVTERRVGHFRRAFQFPLGLAETAKVQATTRLGLLTVVVPKVTGPGTDEARKKLAEARKLDVVKGDVAGKLLGAVLV